MGMLNDITSCPLFVLIIISFMSYLNSWAFFGWLAMNANLIHRWKIAQTRQGQDAIPQNRQREQGSGFHLQQRS